MKRIILAVFVMAAACAPALCGDARNAFITQPGVFASQAASDWAAEEAMARLALQRGKADHVKTFAQKLLQSDAFDGRTLQTVARRYGVRFPAGLSGVDQAKINALSNLAHDEFDHIYMDTVVDNLRNVLHNFSAGANAADPEIARYSQAALPAIQHLLDRAKRVDILVGGGLGPSSGH
jgi:putative membrane protein